MCIHVDTAVRALMYMHACVLNATRQLESQFRDRGFRRQHGWDSGGHKSS